LLFHFFFFAVSKKTYIFASNKTIKNLSIDMRAKNQKTCPSDSSGERWLGMETQILGRESFFYPSKNVNLPFLIKKSLLPF